MNQLKTVTPIIKQGYGRNNILEMIKSLEYYPIFINMRTVQQDELGRIKRSYYSKGYLTPNQKDYMITLHFNFVKNKFKYEDNKVVVKVEKQEQHIGLQMLNKLKSC